MIFDFSDSKLRHSVNAIYLICIPCLKVSTNNMRYSRQLSLNTNLGKFRGVKESVILTLMLYTHFVNPNFLCDIVRN